MKQHHRVIAALSALTLAGLALTACSGGASPEPTESDTTADNAIYDMLPQDVKDAGKLIVATDPQFGPPTNFRPSDDPDGWAGVEPDLLRALEPVLGVTFEWQQATFESIIPGVKSGRYDLGVNSLSDTVERQAQVDMIDWWTGVNVVITKKGNPSNITALEDLCGLTMAIVQGSSDQAYLTEWSAANCGDNPLQLMPFKDRPACILALQTDRVAATAGGTGFSINLAHNLDGNQGNAAETLEILSDVNYAPSPAGIAVKKDREELTDALMAGIQQIMDDGTYAEILEKWYWPEAGFMTSPELNAATT
ncbi:ABC transporter substrate-binding protein [Microbacterium sp.]|uniref:ABC transporter substrate-binding protein n=1 Tax=Microbacterium sp. TaxID=51671 RepID=UPI0039E30751